MSVIAEVESLEYFAVRVDDGQVHLTCLLLIVDCHDLTLVLIHHQELLELPTALLDDVFLCLDPEEIPEFCLHLLEGVVGEQLNDGGTAEDIPLLDDLHVL